MPPSTAFEVARLPLPNAVAAIRSGLPAKAFDGLAQALLMSADDLAGVLGLSIRTIRDQRKRRVRLSRDATEKIVRAARVQVLARKVFTTDAAVSQWLATPAPALDSQRPVDLLDTDVGAREVESILQGVAYGNVM